MTSRSGWPNPRHAGPTCNDAAASSAIAPWQRPAFRPTGRDAVITLIAFADENVLEAGPDLRIHDTVPQGAPVAALDLRMHRYAERPGFPARP